MLRHLETVGMRRLPEVWDESARIVLCRDCGQFEIWDELETIDHGRCRLGMFPCACDDGFDGQRILDRDKGVAATVR